MVRHLTVFHLASRDKAVSATKRLISFLKISTKTHDYVDDADGGFTVCFVSVSQICLKLYNHLSNVVKAVFTG